MSGGRPVARLVAPVITRVWALVGLMALIAITGVVLSTRSVDYVSDRLQPAAAANQDVLQDLTDMEAAVGAYARSGETASIDDYRQALSRLPAHEQRVAQFARGDVELELLVARQEATAQAWLDRYAEPRVAAPGGPETFQPKRFRTGQVRFAEFRSAHQETSEAFDRRVRQANADAGVRLKGTIIAILALAAAAWYVVARARRRLLDELSRPLADLEAVVQRMARNDPDVRAEAAGPQEVRAVAAALNEFAEAQGRARAVEHRIQDELRTLDTAKDDFVSNVSHELRTPLTTISGYLEMVAEEFEDVMAPRHERMLEATRRNVTRLKTLIDDLLTLSKAEARGTDLEQVDVVALVRDAVTDVRITAARRGIQVEVAVPDEQLMVLGDRAMLHRAFLNVTANAVKFSRDGGTVEVAVARVRQRVTVTVTDHGIGIPAAEIDRLGSRFFRASNAVTNEIAGTGLGLRIVQTIIEKHAGDVVIESDEGKGTAVAIDLRLQGEPRARVAAPPPPEPVFRAEPGTERDAGPVRAEDPEVLVETAGSEAAPDDGSVITG
ncbi:HAMP domain-containing protein [Nocardioides sp. KIGAM211]|uniref:histidine kinase n=1 Tax=Nocardioides luti TaxID=2761101 RepID=A0A7X0RLH8_9ACTN|nr:ATP-binding protein [Nocardioides luti]MBB6629198.1 HAMP domain-containing protein [Nocardioides luti]